MRLWCSMGRLRWVGASTRQPGRAAGHHPPQGGRIRRLAVARLPADLLFVDRRYRRKGVAAAAVDGALQLIADAAGGVVEAYPFDTAGKKVSASVLYNATRTMCERAGFTYDRPKGKNHCVMRKVIEPS
jgi:GNAT superfamily N-acetyltransferase